MSDTVAKHVHSESVGGAGVNRSGIAATIEPRVDIECLAFRPGQYYNNSVGNVESRGQCGVGGFRAEGCRSRTNATVSIRPGTHNTLSLTQ